MVAKYPSMLYLVVVTGEPRYNCFRCFLYFQDEGWKLNRNHYYQEGWLSTANLRGVVGVTYTTSHCGVEGQGVYSG